jgi:protein-L-isoaspartate O-methyltransferase
MSDAIRWYDANVQDVSRRYESLAAETVHGWLVDLLPNAPAVVLDVGAGTGRDAAWLVSRGLEVVAVEPSGAMRDEAQRLHPSASIRWISDILPSFDKVLRLGLSFDLILLSAVWMHVSPADRARAFRKLVTLLKPGGCMAITLRHGPAEPERGIYDVSQSEIEHLARVHGAFIERSTDSKDELGRGAVTWTQLAVRLPDDGSGALPLLRHIILNDDKSSTYKLALLRALCRIADGAAGYARETNDGHVAIPLGLVGLYWVRLFKPLLAAGLPQNPTNQGDERLGFVKDGFRKLSGVSHMDLRIGRLFGGDPSNALHSALRDACDTITKMPAHYMTYPGGGPVLPVKRIARVVRPVTIHLNETYLSSFGDLLVPRHLWRALQRFDVWIEPALIAEWSRLMNVYAARQGRRIAEAKIATAMTWSEPSRDVRIAREQACRLIGSSKLHCVWSGRVLSVDALDVDHCFPWTVWPCDDLWNLLPAHRSVNQNQKRDKLPGVDVLRSAQARIQEWWDKGYLKADNQVLPERFMTEAKATLPIVGHVEARLDDVFAALNLQQIRLKHDQQVPVWEPNTATGSLRA